MLTEIKTATAIIIISALAGCGGGDDSTPSTVPQVSTNEIVGFTFAPGNAHAAKPYAEQLAIIAEPILFPSIRTSELVFNNQGGNNSNGFGRATLNCESRSRCSTQISSALIASVTLSDSTQIYLCNGTPGTGGDRDVYVCVDTRPFPDAVVTLTTSQGKQFTKVIRYRAGT